MRKEHVMYGVDWLAATPSDVDGIDVTMTREQVPIHYAAEYSSNPDVLGALIDAGANIEVREYYNQWAPLHFAANSNLNPDVLTVLIDAGADLEAKR